MSLNESIVEDAALEWFGELGYAVGHGPQLAPGEYAGGTLIPAFSQGEKEKDGEVVLVGRLREAIRRLNPAFPSRTLATLRDNLLSGELSVAADSVIWESRITAADGPGQSAASRTRRKTAR
jgi:type I restriction enzyme R subunit